jgi:CubicO group peptidase (beta-lactamase class C family)
VPITRSAVRCLCQAERRQAFLCILLATSPAASASGQSPALIDSINTYVTAQLREQRIPGASLAVLHGDQVVLKRGYGLANVELQVPASDSTIYQSGSMGKQFTAAAVLMLAEQRRLRLDDRITQWFPEGAGVWDSITVRHLLTHTSGLAEYTDSTFDYRKDYTEADLVKFAASRPLDFSPGERWSYSNTGYVLLGVLLHRVTGRFYGNLLQDLIFKPLGMRTARIISEADIVPNRAAGYQLVGEQLNNQDWVSPSLNTTADGALYFTVNDLTRWAVSLNHRRIPNAQALDTAWSPVRLKDGGTYPYGFGWELGDQRGHPRIGHTGSWQGFKTALYRYPEFNLTVIMLANLAQAEPSAVLQGIAGILQPELRPAHLLSPSSLPVYTGSQPISDQLTRIVLGTDSAELVTSGLQRFLSPAFRKEWGDLLSGFKPWTPLGCDIVGQRGMNRLGERIQRICYLRGAGVRGGALISAYYTREGRAAYLDYYLF